VLAEPVDGEHLTDDSPPLLYHMGRYLQTGRPLPPPTAPHSTHPDPGKDRS
jgi:hypothetical protein